MSNFDIGKIDEIIHGRLRLGVMTYLANADVASFSELKASLDVTQGNLSIQLRKLEEAGYIKIEKQFAGRKPLTTARLTANGRKAFARYLKALTDIIDSAGDAG